MSSFIYVIPKFNFKFTYGPYISMCFFEIKPPYFKEFPFTVHRLELQRLINMSTFFDTIKRSYTDVEITEKGINTEQFLEASESLVTMFGEQLSQLD